MTWLKDGDDAVIACDHEGCTQRVKHPIESDDHVAAAEVATRRGWWVPDARGEEVKTTRDYCAAHRPVSTLRGAGISRAEAEQFAADVAAIRSCARKPAAAAAR